MSPTEALFRRQASGRLSAARGPHRPADGKRLEPRHPARRSARRRALVHVHRGIQEALSLRQAVSARRATRFAFAPGTNKLLLMTEPEGRPIYPHFLSAGGGRFAPALEFDSTRLGRRHQIRVYLPPGYEENTLKRYPVVYMQDGQNLFFPEEAFAADWQVDRTVGMLDSMNAVDEFVVVGVYSKDRMAEYTQPGYQTYGESLIGEVKPRIDQEFRTLPGPRKTGVLGSSLGGVVSFFLTWEWPDIFGVAGVSLQHLRPSRRSAPARALGGAAPVPVLPGQRLARGQLRGHGRHGDGAGLTRLGLRARPDALRVSAGRARRARLGIAAPPAAPALPGFRAKRLRRHAGRRGGGRRSRRPSSRLPSRDCASPRSRRSGRRPRTVPTCRGRRRARASHCRGWDPRSPTPPRPRPRARTASRRRAWRRSAAVRTRRSRLPRRS